MKILALTNLYPPHHAGTYDLRVQSIVDSLKTRGHTVHVLTSMHGMNTEQRGGEVERRLALNGVYGHKVIDSYGELRPLEERNHTAFRDALAQGQPDLVFVFSLHGLSKSLLFALRQSRVPTVFDISDFWLSEELQLDPWLRWWNDPNPSMSARMMRTGLEVAGTRMKLEETAPTRLAQGVDRLPELFGKEAARTPRIPIAGSIVKLDCLYFCSEALKQATLDAGFAVSHAEVIYPGISTQQYVGDVKPASAPMQKLLLAGHLDARSGAMTAVRALQSARERGANLALSIYGRGDSDFLATLRSQIAVNQLPVEFLPVSNLVRDLPQILRRHDVFLQTTEWDEPYATAPLEAMAAGLPVIAAAAGGARELFRHGENGLVYSPGEPEELAHWLVELHKDPRLRVQIADNGQQEVLSKFNETAVMDRIEAFLQSSRESWGVFAG